MDQLIWNTGRHPYIGLNIAGRMQLICTNPSKFDYSSKYCRQNAADIGKTNYLLKKGCQDGVNLHKTTIC